MSRSLSRWLALTTLLVAVAMAAAACGGSSSGSPSTVAPSPSSSVAPTPSSSGPLATTTGSPAALSCPTATTVGAALGISLSTPTTVPGGGGTPLPAGATGVSCDYRATSANVLIQLIANISPTYIDQFSSRYPVPYASVPGVGDQARSFLQPLNGGKDNEGVVGTKGSNLVAITATATPASLAQVEALVNQLL